MSHSHDHSHHHHHHGKDQTEGRLWISIGLNLMITLTEFFGGIFSGSLSLLSDAVHNLSDTASLGISLAARKIAGKRADKDKTFGYRRAEIIGAFINLVTLVLISIFLIKKGIERFYNPQPIDGWVMFLVAFVGLAGNFITAFLLYKSSEDNLNIRSAYIHILSDGLSSVGVLIAGWLIISYQLYIIDTILTFIIAAYIMWHSYHMLRETIDILMESTPEEINVDEVTRKMQGVQGVENIHHVHIWRLDETNILLESHVMIRKHDLSELETIKSNLKEILETNFEITHSTLEFEFEPCNHLEKIPHHD